MKRRTFGLLAGTSLAALKCGSARAQAARNPSLLTTTLTPVGAERAGNAEGSIPAWTGGYTTVPAGWQPGQYMPDFFAADPIVVTIDSSNMAQHADKLAEGTMALMSKYGFSVKVYPTHRTGSAPQWVYDNIAKNCTTAQLDPLGVGFSNAYGGIPFPIPDVSIPLDAGAEIIWNHQMRWQGHAYIFDQQSWAVSNGATVLSSQATIPNLSLYYDPNGSLATYKGVSSKQYGMVEAPANGIGGRLGTWFFSDPSKNQDESWVLLKGQNRVRRAPELQHDTPDSYSEGLLNWDETFAFVGPMEQYDWKYIGKSEMYIPYNNNALFAATAQQVLGPHFMNPEFVRWELHRVWIVEATVRTGYRNTLQRRRFYVDEDTWTCLVTDSWDAENNLYHTQQLFNYVRPDVPGTIMVANCVYDMQTGDYVVPNALFNQKIHPTVNFPPTLPESQFDPSHLAAQSEY